MATMIPDTVDYNDPKSNGERLVYQWLSEYNISGFVFHSLLQKNHKHKIMGEVDFLYICERGLLCIEVKGGQDIYCKDKKWFTFSRSQNEYEISNPFLQAQDCMFALKRYISDIYGRDSFQAKYLFGFAVIFPECKFTGSGNDLLTEVLFDNTYSLSEFSSFLINCFNYWEKTENEKHNRNIMKLSAEQMEQIVNLLRGDFRVVPSMNLEMQHIQQKMILLTEEQFDILDNTKLNKRVIIQGVAGTGKSVLALEKFRQSVSVNKKTLYLCYNRNMAKYANISVQNLNFNESSVSTFHSLIQKIFSLENLYEKSIDELCSLVKDAEIKDDNVFDYVIVDEAQDLMNISVIDILDKLLKGGLKNGEWIFFLDPNQNIFNNDREYKFALDYINESFCPAHYILNCNCRNTEQIARSTSVISLVPTAKYLKLSGPIVRRFIYSDKKELRTIFRKELISLFSSGTSSADIIILSRYKYINSGISGLQSLNNLDIVENNDINKFNKNAINYFTVQSYKGLESNIVFYIDIDGFSSEYDRFLNYVAMSRAKIMLYLFYADTAKEEYNNITAEGLNLL
jgi:hypothetical protein